MNIDRLNYIASWLAAGAPHQGKVAGFNISVGVQVNAVYKDGNYIPACGTTCCIAGAATQFFNDEDKRLLKQAKNQLRDNLALSDSTSGEAYWDEVFLEAQTLLGLSSKQAAELFVPIGTDSGGINADLSFGNDNWDAYNDPRLAAKVILNLIETSEVNWNIE